MISSLRNFAKTKIAGIFIFIIIIPFVFWGMGGVFNSGNTNNIAKINNTNISTQDFMDYLRKSKLSTDVIQKNIDKNILEELLSALISTTLLDLEIKDYNITMSADILIKKLKRNKNFLDENGEFKRTLYEKFLLSNNITAPLFEIRLKNNELQRQLFTYINGGTVTPKFLVKKYYKDQNRKLDIDYINLKNFYKEKSTFSDDDLKKFINENAEELKQDYIDFSYINITPKSLIGLDEFNQNFFDKIDEIENKISKNIDFKTIVSELNVDIKATIKTNYMNFDNKETIENKIYKERNNKAGIIENNGIYTFFQIEKITSKIPNLDNTLFKKKITNLLYQKEKYDFNKKILEKIKDKKFNQISFDKLGKNLIEKTQIDSNKDDKKFEINSIEILYSLPINTFTLIADSENNVFVAKVTKFEEKYIDQDSKEFDKFIQDIIAQKRSSLLNSYDYFLNNKYKVTINEKTLDRVKNYFK
jgi:peptidyl-prolyl cis-trans isomerase D